MDSNGGVVRQKKKIAFGRGSESKKASGLNTYHFAGFIELMILTVNPIDMVDTGRAKATEIRNQDQCHAKLDKV